MTGGGVLSVILEVSGSSGGNDVIRINVLRVFPKSYRQAACNTLTYVADSSCHIFHRSLFIIVHPVLSDVSVAS